MCAFDAHQNSINLMTCCWNKIQRQSTENHRFFWPQHLVTTHKFLVMQGLLETIWVRLQSPYVRCISFYDTFVIAVMLIKYTLIAYIHIFQSIFNCSITIQYCNTSILQKKCLFKLISPGLHPSWTQFPSSSQASLNEAAPPYLTVAGCGGVSGILQIYHLWKNHLEIFAVLKVERNINSIEYVEQLSHKTRHCFHWPYVFIAFSLLPGLVLVTFVPWSKLPILGMVIPPLIGILIMGI